MLDTVRRLGFLQLDPIATVATPQQLVLWSRLGSFDTTELERLVASRKLFEWNAFLRAGRRAAAHPRTHATDAQSADVRLGAAPPRLPAGQRGFRRYVLRELERRGPLLSRELEDRSVQGRRDHRWFGARRVTDMLTILHLRGEVAIVGRRTGQRLWDLAQRWYPEAEVPPLEEAERELEERRFRSLE